jgi:hypothetical protein
MRLLTVRLVVVLAASGLTGAARGEFVDFSYSWSMKPAPVLPSGTGNVTFSLEAGDVNGQIGGAGVTIPGATIQTSSVAAGAGDKYNADFDMTLKLKEGASSGDLTFKATVAGALTGSSSSATVAFHNPVTQTAHVGGHYYMVTIGPTTVSVPSPVAAFTARIDALVRVAGVTSPTPPPPHPSSTPEPSSLVLAVLAAPALAAAWRRGKGHEAPVEE